MTALLQALWLLELPLLLMAGTFTAYLAALTAGALWARRRPPRVA